jgi:hypothetical protein
VSGDSLAIGGIESGKTEAWFEARADGTIARLSTPPREAKGKMLSVPTPNRPYFPGGYPGGYPGGGYPGGGRGTSRLPEADGRRIMEEIATRTGGVYFEAKKSADLMEIYSRAGQDVLSQYLVSYSPDPSSDDADFHKVVIKAVKGDLVVNAPEGYYSSKDDTK